MVLDHHAALRNSRRAARFKDIRRLTGIRLRNPPARRPSPEPFVFKQRKLLNISVALHFLERIELQLLLLAEPKRAAGGIVKVMLNRFISVLIQLVLSSLNTGLELGR